MPPSDRQTRLPYDRDEQLRLIAAAAERLRRDGCWTRSQVTNAERLMRAIVEAPRGDDRELDMTALAARMELSVRQAQKVVVFAERLGLVVVERFTGLRRPHRYYVDFDALRGAESGRPLVPRSMPATTVSGPQKRSEQSAERSEVFASRNEKSSERSEQSAERENAAETMVFGQSAPRIDAGTPVATCHVHVLKTSETCHMPTSGAAAVAPPESGPKRSADELALISLVERRRADAAARAPREPAPARDVLRALSLAAVAPLATANATERTAAPLDAVGTIADELERLVGDPNAPRRMFDDVAFHVAAGRLSRDRAVGIAKEIQRDRGKLKRPGGAFRVEIERAFPAGMSPWRKRPTAAGVRA